MTLRETSDTLAASRGPDGVIGQDADYLERIADARAAELEGEYAQVPGIWQSWHVPAGLLLVVAAVAGAIELLVR